MRWTSQWWAHHVYSFVDDDVLDLAHLNKFGRFPTRGVAGRHLDSQGANDQQRLVVNLHKVDVEHHANQGDDYSCWQDSCVLQYRGDMDNRFPRRQSDLKKFACLRVSMCLEWQNAQSRLNRTKLVLRERSGQAITAISTPNQGSMPVSEICLSQLQINKLDIWNLLARKYALVALILDC